MTDKKMKTSRVKKVVVECKLKDQIDIKEFDIDPEIFDDILLEAATRFAEQHIKKNNSKIAPILTTWEKKDEKNYDKHICYNSYYVIINAGFYRKAEIMRRNFMAISNVDLKKESIRSNGKSRENN